VTHADARDGNAFGGRASDDTDRIEDRLQWRDEIGDRRVTGIGMKKNALHVGETPATRLLRSRGVGFSEHVYDYVEHGGTAESARQLGVPEHEVIKTLVMQTQFGEPFIVLMHGDCTVVTRELARQLGAKTVQPCAPADAERHTGYRVGGTSPFGTRKTLRVCVEESVLALPRICINGGRRGYLVGIEPKVLVELLDAEPVRCASA
jgi:Cys-tRNA(Pro) deacylase